MAKAATASANIPQTAATPAACDMAINAELMPTLTPMAGARYRSALTPVMPRSICMAFFQMNTVSVRPESGRVHPDARARTIGRSRIFLAARRAAA